jgi:hypothetical protein
LIAQESIRVNLQYRNIPIDSCVNINLNATKMAFTQINIYMHLPTLLLFLSLWSACRSVKPIEHNFPDPVDTSDRPVELQSRKTYSIGGVSADNQFDAARLNGFEQLNDSTFVAHIAPENKPINMSPWYAFRLWADTVRHIHLILKYADGSHRYHPKISNDGRIWTVLDSQQVSKHERIHASLKLNLNKDTLWLAAQEIINSAEVKAWSEKMALHEGVMMSMFGKSKLGRDMYFLDIHEGSPKKKDIIVVFSRQHPPEVTGFFAMQHFVEELLAANTLSDAFRKKYRILVFPILNPDGVDMGHWRHNAGGIDLNRDWAFYRQPETRQVAEFLVKEVKRNRARVLLGLDFHSTWQDVYYTGSVELTSKSVLPHFKDYWLYGIQNALGGYRVNDQPSGLNAPVTKGWFFVQFNAEGITYEIGDGTPRDFIKVKSTVAATEMMRLLIYRR